MKYEIEGGSLPVAILHLDPGEKIITQKGAMSWMSANMKMQTTSGGGLGKMLGRAFSGESMFQNIYQAEGGPGLIAFASRLPGNIRMIEIKPGFDYICQKGSFLCSTENVVMSVFWQKKLGAGLFGGEGFIMQKMSGQGQLFIEIDGYAKEYTLGPGQSLVVDTGYLVAMSASCQMDIKAVGGFTNTLFGGEGIFNTYITGPGSVIVQSMPLGKLRDVLGINELEAKINHK